MSPSPDSAGSSPASGAGLSFGPAWRWGAVLTYLALIHLMSSFSLPERALPSIEGVEKLAHMGEFGLLALLLWRPVRDAAPAMPELRTAAWVLAIAAGNGLLDEWHQSFVPGRHASWLDAAADALGAGAAVFWMLHREKNRIAPPRGEILQRRNHG